MEFDNVNPNDENVVAINYDLFSSSSLFLKIGEIEFKMKL